jgi:hypothetical protein
MWIVDESRLATRRGVIESLSVLDAEMRGRLARMSLRDSGEMLNDQQNDSADGTRLCCEQEDGSYVDKSLLVPAVLRSTTV